MERQMHIMTMNSKRRRWGRIAIAAMLLPLAVHGEDIDIFQPNPGTADNPNVLIVLDNSTNWSRNEQHWENSNNGIATTQGQMELKALAAVIAELTQDVNVGLMMLTEGGGAGTFDGGYIRYHMRPMDGINKSAFLSMLGASAGCVSGPNAVTGTPNCILPRYDDPDQKVNTASSNWSNALFEIFKYFGGYSSPANAFSDTGGTPLDASHFGPYRYSGAPTSASSDIANGNSGAINRDLAAYTSSSLAMYNPPLSDTNQCAKNFVIWIGNDPNLNVDSPSALLSGVGGTTTQLSWPKMVALASGDETLITTTSYGQYADRASCEAAAPSIASSLGYGSFSSYRCEQDGPGQTGTTTTEVTNYPVSSCGQFSSAAACQADLLATYGGNASEYACTPTGGACNYNVALSPAVVLANPTACLSLSNASSCVTWAATQWPGYGSFSCTNGTTCGGGKKTWKVEAGLQNFTDGQQYSRTRTVTSSSSGTVYKWKVFGSYTFNTYSPLIPFEYTAPTVSHYADEWTKFLNETDVSGAAGRQNVKTYVIDVRRLWQNSNDRDKTQLMMSMAQAGGGKYFNAQSQTAIANALRRIFAEIQAVNSVFASSSLPVSVTGQSQGVYKNQVFIGMFRPSGSAEPRWPGNLKQYEFKFFGGQVKLADKSGQEAISSTTGFVTPCAESYWGSDTVNYWNYPASSTLGSCGAIKSAGGVNSYYSDVPDGEVVEKGGVAQKLRGTVLSGTTYATSTRYSECGSGVDPTTDACRKLFTCDGSSATSCTALTNFGASNAAITAAALGVASGTPTRADLIDWIRGKDVQDENADGKVTEVRPSVHGGVVHSEPVIVDYGGTTGTVAYYGADDGVFRAVGGEKTAATGGVEYWGFIAPETYGRFKRLYQNDPLIDFPGVGAVNKKAKDYFFDGAIGVHQDFTDNNDSTDDTVWLFPTMRRGGRALYAFDVSNPMSPSLMWRKGCFPLVSEPSMATATDWTCSAGWENIGQTWSRPRVGFLKGYVDSATSKLKPVLVLGAGYDSCEDVDSQVRCSGTPKGSAILFVDAKTGRIIRNYPTTRGVTGDVSLELSATREIERVYAGDLGGNLYRIEVGGYSYDETAVPPDTYTNWTSNASAASIKLASLSETNQARKFMYGPNVTRYRGVNYVMIGSGDREHPLGSHYACNNFAETGGVTNQFYMVKDFPATTLPGTPLTPSDLLTVGADGSVVKGCKMNLNPCEQVVNKAATAGGATYFGTNQPYQTAANTCGTNLGRARCYALDFETCNYSWVDCGEGLPPSPRTGVVEICEGSNCSYVPICIGCGKPPAAPPDPTLPPNECTTCEKFRPGEGGCPEGQEKVGEECKAKCPVGSIRRADGTCPPPTPPCESGANYSQIGGTNICTNVNETGPRIYWRTPTDQ